MFLYTIFHYSLAGVLLGCLFNFEVIIEVSTQVFTGNPWSLYVFLPSLKLAQRSLSRVRKRIK